MEGGCQNSPVRKSNRATMHGDCLFKKSLREAKTADCRGKEVLCKMISQKELPIRRGCASLEISRRTYYYSLKERRIDTSDKAITDGILDIASEFQKYGYRRITAELHRRGQPVNHKKVLRIMREENILCTPKKKFRITTTDSNHGYPVYPNLAKDIILIGINKFWVADITYVHLLHECVYLAVIIDVYSRKCIGWALSRRIDAELVLNALDMAIKARVHMGIGGLIHHSNQGINPDPIIINFIEILF